MARTIYREWFVEFRFPGHRDVRMVDSELRSIPEGWAAVRVSDAIEISPRTPVPDGEKRYVPMVACL